ncbi:glycosyl transferase [Candidatus Parcubacteria bacterium]|nr:MAG: glycosyl transferase [Candidatus Parcubacteria bacterium]
MKFDKLSIIIPVFNERETIEKILRNIEEADLGVEKELIIVDDGSVDGTREILEGLEYKYRIIYHDKNRGKGAAMRTGIDSATGDFIVPQDADTEYDPLDLRALIESAKHNKAKAVFGSRRLGRAKKKNVKAGWSYYLGGVMLTWITNILYGTRITDEPTCYKLVDRELISSFEIESQGFEYCPEVTAKIAKRKIKIHEVPISYNPRSIAGGKKIRPKDGLVAIWTLLRYRL